MNDEQVIALAWEEYEELLHLIAPTTMKICIVLRRKCLTKKIVCGKI